MRRWLGIVLSVLLLPSAAAILDTDAAVNGTLAAFTFEGTPPFTLNIRDDTFIGEVGGFMWATTDENFILVNLSLIDNPSGRFFYGVQDANNWSLLDAFNLNPVPLQERTFDPVDVTVDFGQSQTAKSMLGFNRGFGSTEPPDEMLLPLNPTFMRDGQEYFIDSGLYDRVTGMGARVMFEVATHGVPGLWEEPPNRKAPYENFTKFDEVLREIADVTKDFDLIYESWNEPDCSPWPYTGCTPGENGTYFWGTEEQYHQTFTHMHDVLREELGPDITIAAPSYAGLMRDNKDHIVHRFLHYAYEQGHEVDILVWHELSGRQDVEFPQMMDDLLYMRALYMEDPRYASLGIDEIIINEFISKSNHFRPGPNLAQMRYLEDGGADTAGRTCWDDSESNGRKNCWIQTLNGLLTQELPDNPGGGREPRGVWWAYKWYADSVSDRVLSTSSHHKIAPFASTSTNESNEAQVLLAHSAYEKQAWTQSQDISFWINYFDLTEPPTEEEIETYVANFTGNFSKTNVSLTLKNLDSIPFLDNPTEVGVAVYKIPYNLSNETASGEYHLPEPVLVEERTLSVTNGEASMLVENIGLYEVWQVKVLDYLPGQGQTGGGEFTWTDGFEELGETQLSPRDGSGWSGARPFFATALTDMSVNVTETIVRTGSYSLNVTAPTSIYDTTINQTVNGTAYIRKTNLLLLEGDQVEISAWYYLPSGYNFDNIHILHLGCNSYNCHGWENEDWESDMGFLGDPSVNVYITDQNTLGLNLTSGNGTVGATGSGSTQLPRDTWFSVTMWMQLGASSDGILRISLNDNQEMEYVGPNNVPNYEPQLNRYHSFKIGVTQNLGSEKVELYVDDVTIDLQHQAAPVRSNLDEPLDIKFKNKPWNNYHNGAYPVDHHTFYSPTVGWDIGYNIYLPPGYHQPEQEDSYYPVVYFLHGKDGGETAGTFISGLVDAHIRAGNITPRIYVFVNGNPTNHFDKTDHQAETAFLELIEHVDTHYRTIPDRDHRAITGYSMGGRASARNGFKYDHLFRWSMPGGSSAAHELNEYGLPHEFEHNMWDLAETYAADPEKLPIYILDYYGETDKAWPDAQGWLPFLDFLGIPHDYIVVDGYGHDNRGMYEDPWSGEILVRWPLNSTYVFSPQP